jgi:hypothetical protein
MDKKIKFNIIKPSQIFYNYVLLEIKFNKGILINNFTIKSNKLFKFNLTLNNHSFLTKNDFFIDDFLESKYDTIDGYYYNFKFDSDIFIETIKYKNYNDNTNIYFEYDDTNMHFENDDIVNKYLDQYVFTKKYFKFISDDENTKDIKINNIIEHKLVITNKGKKIEFNKIDEYIYKFKYLKNNTYYIEFDEIQYKKNDYIYNFNSNNYISSYYPIL